MVDLPQSLAQISQAAATNEVRECEEEGFEQGVPDELRRTNLATSALRAWHPRSFRHIWCCAGQDSHWTRVVWGMHACNMARRIHATWNNRFQTRHGLDPRRRDPRLNACTHK